MSNSNELIINAEKALAPYWAELEQRCHDNFERVLSGFLTHQVNESHFHSVTGYGHNDTGREVVDKLFAHAFHAEAALVRLQLVSGTHAIYTGLRAALTPNASNLLISLTGAPYDTLEEVIGTRGTSAASLKAMGCDYQELNFLTETGIHTEFTPEEIASIQNASIALIQRSRGYNSTRISLSISQIESLIQQAKAINPQLKIVVDNCYGEFIETLEPTAVGADLIAGSLIKNPGGGLVTTGGYIAGRADLVSAGADFLTAPGIGAEGGYTFDSTRMLLQGLYFAPTTVFNALKSMSLFAHVFEQLNYDVFPRAGKTQSDIIQVIRLGEEQKILDFCRVLQSVSPIDSNLTPIPDVTPGYADPVIMAGGTFIFGSTIELSADAPIREPYAVYLQGGLVYSHARFALQRILEHLNNRDVTNL